jgi:hypothetical protein
VRHRVAEAREQFAVVRDDVAIVHRHHPRLVARQHVAAARPDIAALAGGPRAELGGLEFAEQVLHARTVVPEQDRLLRQLAEKAPGLLPVAQVGPVDADDDLLEVFDALQLARDEPQRLGAEFADMTGQHERDRRLLHELTDLALEPCHVGRSETVKGGDGARLEEVRHDRNSPAAGATGGGTKSTASGATSA